MQLGRNDPCFCGSGKKFKKCCLLNQPAPSDFLWRQLRTIHDNLAGRLTGHAQSEFGEESLDEAWEEFWLWDDEREAFDPESYRNQLFFPFYLYNWYREEGRKQAPGSPKNRTVAKDYLKVRGPGLSELERRFLTACIEAPFSFHEVLEVDPGEAFLLKDIFLGTETLVSEKSGSRSAQIGDIFFGKVVKVDHVAMLCGSGWIVLPPTTKHFIIELRKTIRAEMTEDGRSVDAEVLHEYDVDLRELFLDLQRSLLSPPVLCNTDGDLMAFHRITYEVPSVQIAFDALKSLSLVMSEKDMLEDAEFDSDGALLKVKIDWHKRGNKKHKQWDNTVLGHLEIEGTKLKVEVNSEKRAKKIKMEIKKRLGDKAIHRGTVVQSPEAMMRESETAGRPERNAEGEREQEELMKSPEVQEQIRKMMEAHWENWYREKIPALGNRTPLQSAKDSDGRELLEALLREYERKDGQRENPALQPDFVAMRKRLGLPARGK
jgi:SEC-C motif